ncbi:MAG: flagellar hook-basal body complex protein FliE [Candidatus Thermoplasmatota archaeon]|nr:flagellar hook-basal body complex protein FliE [Candidatus Thermoplasmatota archaeon]
MKIVAFTGLPASGKSEAVIIAKDKGIPVVRMGDLVWEETQRQGRPLDDKNVGDVASSMRKHYGMDIWARRTVEKIGTLKNASLLIIDGVRNKEELEFFYQMLGEDFILIAIDAPDELRRKRALSRGRTDDAKDLRNLEERDRREIAWGLQKVIAQADIVIPNRGSLSQFRKQVEDVLKTF